MTKDKQKANKPLNPFVPLVLMVLACAIVSYFVIPGAYDRETVDGVTRVLADSYHATERTPVSFFNIFRSIPEGLTASANMMFCVMLIGGIVEIYKRTNTVGAAINSVLKASERMSSQVIIAIVMIVFSFSEVSWDGVSTSFPLYPLSYPWPSPLGMTHWSEWPYPDLPV